jgi:two-component system response regulator PilR (NtrC family)
LRGDSVRADGKRVFGHRKGSFTGAVEDKPGLFQAAHGGTLFLDEVADLPLPMQVKLLRAIQEKPCAVSATQEDGGRCAHSLRHPQGSRGRGRRWRFRQDLYYRLNVIELRVPSLRERRDDIQVLAAHAPASGGRQRSSGGPPAPTGA